MTKIEMYFVSVTKGIEDEITAIVTQVDVAGKSKVITERAKDISWFGAIKKALNFINDGGWYDNTLVKPNCKIICVNHVLEGIEFMDDMYSVIVEETYDKPIGKA